MGLEQASRHNIQEEQAQAGYQMESWVRRDKRRPCPYYVLHGVFSLLQWC